MTNEKDSPKYNLLPAMSNSKTSNKLCIVYANSYIQYHNYSNIHHYIFSPEGDRLYMTIAYSPPLILTGRNLLQLEDSLEHNKLPRLTVYREDYHIPPATEKPLITGAYYSTKNKQTGEALITEALPLIPDPLEGMGSVETE